jgi:hypothetical protein
LAYGEGPRVRHLVALAPRIPAWRVAYQGGCTEPEEQDEAQGATRATPPFFPFRPVRAGETPPCLHTTSGCPAPGAVRGGERGGAKGAPLVLWSSAVFMHPWQPPLTAECSRREAQVWQCGTYKNHFGAKQRRSGTVEHKVRRAGCACCERFRRQIGSKESALRGRFVRAFRTKREPLQGACEVKWPNRSENPKARSYLKIANLEHLAACRTKLSLAANDRPVLRHGVQLAHTVQSCPHNRP